MYLYILIKTLSINKLIINCTLFIFYSVSLFYYKIRDNKLIQIKLTQLNIYIPFF